MDRSAAATWQSIGDLNDYVEICAPEIRAVPRCHASEGMREFVRRRRPRRLGPGGNPDLHHAVGELPCARRAGIAPRRHHVDFGTRPPSPINHKFDKGDDRVERPNLL